MGMAPDDANSYLDKKMDVSQFVEDLKKPGSFSGLTKFLVAIEASDDPRGIVRELLKVSANCDEILGLSKNYQLSSDELATLFNVLSHIIMHIATSLDEYHSVGVHISMCVLDNHVEDIENLLTGEKRTQRIVPVLRCLTAMVSLGELCANKVLTSVNWSKIPFRKYANSRNPKAEMDLRTIYTFLVLAFLKVDDDRLVNRFVQVEGFLTWVFFKLNEDESTLIEKFIILLRKKVILNSEISKTTKIKKIFTLSHCICLVELLYWKGPDGEVVEKDVRLKIRAVVLELMLTLCTDYRYGIIFQKSNDKMQIGRGDSYRRHYNRHILDMFIKATSPWTVKEGRELMAATFSKCPDLVRLFINHMGDTINSPSTYPSYLGLIRLFDKMISIQTPWLIIEEDILKNKFKGQVPSFSIVPFDFVVKLLDHNELILKHVGTKLLATYLLKLKETIDKVKESPIIPNDEKTALIDELETNFDKSGMFLSKLKRYCLKLMSVEAPKKGEKTKQSGDVEEPITCAKQMADILKLYATYAELFGVVALDMYKNLGDILDYIVNLRKEMANDTITYTFLLENVLHIVALHQKEGLGECTSSQKPDSPDTDLLNIVIKLYHYFCINDNVEVGKLNNSRQGQRICLDILLNILRDFGISDCNVEFVKLWLYNMSSDNLSDLCKFFASVICNTASNLSSYFDRLIELKNISGESHHTLDILSIIDNLPEENFADADSTSIKIIPKPFSCLVLGAIDSVTSTRDTNETNYFSNVLLEYIHFCDEPSILARYLISANIPFNTNTKIYLKSWINKVDNTAKVKLEEDATIFDKLRYVFIKRETFPTSSLGLETNLQSYHVTVKLTRELLSYLSRENEQGKLKSKELYKFYIKVLKKVLKITLNKQDDGTKENYLRFLLSHQALLKLYEPFLHNSSSTLLVEDVLDAALSSSLSSTLTERYRRKLLENLESLSLEHEIHNSAYVFLKYNSLTYAQAEKMFIMSITLPFYSNCVATELVLQITQPLLKFSDRINDFSSSNTNLFICKFIEADAVSKDDNEISELRNVLLELLSKVINKDNVSSISETSVKQITELQPFPSSLCCRLMELRPSTSTLLVAYLNNTEFFDLKVHGPILAKIFVKFKSDKVLEPCIKKVKPLLKNWIRDNNSEYDINLDVVLNHMLTYNHFKVKEVIHICQNRLDLSLKKGEIPLHMLSLLLAYKHLCKEEKLNVSCKAFQNGELSWAAKTICLTIAVLRSNYGKESKDFHDIDLFTDLISVLNLHVPEVDCTHLHVHLRDNGVWMDFVKKVLKHSLTDERIGADLLGCLIMLFNKVFKQPDAFKSPIELIFTMLVSHSEFIGLLLSSTKSKSKVREMVLRLQLTLIEKCPDLCSEEHAALLLGAYGATMSLSDQIILKTLMLCERNDNLSTLSMNIWGKDAISFYSIGKSSDEPIYKEPKYHQAFAILDSDMVIATALKFNPSLDLALTDMSVDDPSIYDQRFLLMLFLNLTSDSKMDIIKAAEKGVISIAIAALTSDVNLIWKCGASLLKNCTEMFEVSKYMNRKRVWMWAIYSFCYGLSGQKTRVPMITASFIIKAMQLLPKPGEDLYQPVLNYIYLRPSFDLHQIPELYRFYFSESIETHSAEMQFLLELLADGIRSPVDLNICLKQHVPRMILGTIVSAASWPCKTTAMRAIKSMISIPRGVSVFTLKHGLISQLNSFLSAWLPDSIPENCVLIFIDILQQVLNFLTNSRESQNKNMAELGVKRKKVESNKTKKRQKTLNGVIKKEDEVLDLNSEEKVIRSSEMEVKFTSLMALTVDLKFTLKKLVEIAVRHMSFCTIEKCFRLLSKYIEYVQVLHNPGKKNRTQISKVVIDAYGMPKKEVKSWINFGILSRRLDEYLTEEERTIFVGSISAAVKTDLRSKLLSEYGNNRDCSLSREIEVDTLIKSVRQFLNS